MNPASIVQQQAEAYNRRDLQGFANCFSDNIQLFNFGEQQPFLEGKADFLASYSNTFEQSPNLKATIHNRMVMGNTVIDHEKVTGRKGIDALELIVIYEIQDSKITKVTYLKNIDLHH